MSALLAYTILSLHAILHNNNGIMRRKHRRVNSKRSRQWRRRALPFALVVRCQKKASSHPPWLDGTLFMFPHISKHLQWMGRRVRAQAFFRSRRYSKRSNGFEPFGGLLKSSLDDFLRVDCDYLQLSRLLSKFKSIDHEKNIASCIARVVALRGTFENRPVGGGKLDPRSVI
jgi:hypothetical protein